MLAVPLREDANVPKAKIGAQIDHASSGIERGGHRPGCYTMGKCREYGIHTYTNSRRIKWLEDGFDLTPERRVHLGKRLARVLLRREPHQRDIGMPREQANQLGTGIPGRTSNRDLDEGGHPLSRGLPTASSTAAACGPCGARTSFVRPRVDHESEGRPS